MAKYTQADLANIKAMIAGGLDQAMIAGEMVRYRSLADLLKIQHLIEADLSASSQPVMPVRYAATTDRGV